MIRKVRGHRPHLRDHLADGRPKGLFHRTPCSCTLVLMSRTSESDCSMDDHGDSREFLDEDENILLVPPLGSLDKNKKNEKSVQRRLTTHPGGAGSVRPPQQQQQTNPNKSAGWNDAAANTLISWRRTAGQQDGRGRGPVDTLQPVKAAVQITAAGR